jgi:predicted metal-dependent hydrolase
VEFHIKYSTRKTVSIQVKDGKVIVHSPLGIAKERLASIVDSHRLWIEKSLKKQSIKAEKYPEPTNEEERYLRGLARKLLPPKMEYYSKIMGLKYGRITITGAKSRFGSCSSKGNIAFSYRLMRYPEEAIDYVVVHELAHLVEMNHSPRFYAIVEKVLPDYKERKKLLK